MKKIWKILLIVFASLATIVGIFAGICKFSYNESFMAGVTNVYLKLTKRGEKFNNPAVARQYMNEISKTNTKELDVPKSKYGIEIEEVETEVDDGFQAFIYNKQENPEQTVFYFHGGAFINQPNNQQYNMALNTVKNTDCQLILMVYPKAPVYNCEYSINKCAEFITSFTSNNSIGKSVFMGDSAGGCIALVMAEYFNEHNESLKPEELILISPVTDLTGSLEEEQKQYLDIDPMLGVDGLNVIYEEWADNLELTDYRVSPLKYDDLECMTDIKITMFGGGREVLRVDQAYLDDTLKDAGFDDDNYSFTFREELIHCYVICPIPEASKDLKTIYNVITRSAD